MSFTRKLFCHVLRLRWAQHSPSQALCPATLPYFLSHCHRNSFCTPPPAQHAAASFGQHSLQPSVLGISPRLVPPVFHRGQGAFPPAEHRLHKNPESDRGRFHRMESTAPCPCRDRDRAFCAASGEWLLRFLIWCLYRHGFFPSCRHVMALYVVVCTPAINLSVFPVFLCKVSKAVRTSSTASLFRECSHSSLPQIKDFGFP